jgi:DNA polymerase-1
MSKTIAIDIETFDPHLSELGNGAIRKDGSILCISMYDGKQGICYDPRDPNDAQLVKDMLADKSNTWIAHNGVYDYDWLQNGMGWNIAGRMEDTMTRASLIDEYAGHYNLNACCLREGVQGKNMEDTIEQWWKDVGGQGNVMANLPLVPFDIVAKYNIQDCKATYELFQKQQPKIDFRNLTQANDLECDQFPLILEMRKNGIRIDHEFIELQRQEAQSYVDEKLYYLQKEYGLTSLSKKKGEGALPVVLERIGADAGMLRTPTGALSTAFDSLLRSKHPIAKVIIDLNLKKTMLDKFLNGVFVKFPIGDRIHSTFKPTKRDDGGTITGRYSSSEPNAQNYSYMENKGGKIIRGCFIADEGCWLSKLDYSQIEYRILAHLAVGPGSQALRDMLTAGGDYHGATLEILGWKGHDARRRIKNFNFGIVYGMGLNGFKRLFEFEAAQAASEMGMSTDAYTTHYYNEYMRRMTFIRPTTNALEAMCIRNKGIHSIGGRFHSLPPDGQTYKMPNYYIQGSASDIIKMGMRDAWKAGVFNTLKLHLMVHDELVQSVPKSKEGLEAVKELQHAMTNCYELKVPILVEPGIGKDWYWAGEKLGKRCYELMCNKMGMAA